MNSLLNHYNPKLPVYLVKQLQSLNYDSEKFINWYVKRHNPLNSPSISNLTLSKKSLWLVIFCYYFWIIYVLSALAIAYLNVLVGLAAIFTSPFLVGGIVYGVAYAFEKLYTEPKHKRLQKNTKRNKK